MHTCNTQPLEFVLIASGSCNNYFDCNHYFDVAVCVFTGDAFFKAAIFLLAEAPRTLLVDGKVRSSESTLHEYTAHLLAVLLVVPVSTRLTFWQSCLSCR